MNYSLFVSCAKGLEYLLEDELKALGMSITRVNPQGVYGDASLTIIYQLCLWSRLANRVQVILLSGDVTTEQSIHKLCTEFDWQTVFTTDKTLAVEFHGLSNAIRNTMYGAQIVKDGIVDHFRKVQGVRPYIDKERPQILIHAYLKNDVLTLSFDVTGYSMHQRGYRTSGGIAPLKENSAAALLIRAKWPELAALGYALHDPFCGSGTLVIEAAMMASHLAPGLLRQDQSLQYWTQHKPALWEELRLQARAQFKPSCLKISGSDIDTNAIALAGANAERAGVFSLVEFALLPVQDNRPLMEKGLIIGNPPYGERLGDESALVSTYQQLGTVLHQYYQGWKAAFLTSNAVLAKAIGLRSNKQYKLFNGALECKLYCFSLSAENKLKDASSEAISEQATMFLNRLKKNYSHLSKWVRKNQISCYRVYDADLPEYAYAIDIYNDYAVLQEYMAPPEIPLHKTEKRSLDVFQIVPQVLNISSDKMVIKRRQQQKGLQQYEKINETHQHLIVTEGKARFKVNLQDYLDTGLFLDHRLLRLGFADLKPETRFLNCFCYTATASVHAALAGALTTSVDLSNTYLRWALENFKLNNINLSRHQLIQSDCLEWLKLCRDTFDVIFLDPPSFSNSKRMANTLDVQRDHLSLIKMAMTLLSPGGSLYFSTHLRSFKMDPKLSDDYLIKDISSQTLDVDFKRNAKIHYCFLIKHKANLM